MRQEAMNFKKQGRLYGRVWREKRKGGSHIIIISKNKSNVKMNHINKWHIQVHKYDGSLPKHLNIMVVY